MEPHLSVKKRGPCFRHAAISRLVKRLQKLSKTAPRKKNGAHAKSLLHSRLKGFRQSTAALFGNDCTCLHAVRARGFVHHVLRFLFRAQTAALEASSPELVLLDSKRVQLRVLGRWICEFMQEVGAEQVDEPHHISKGYAGLRTHEPMRSVGTSQAGNHDLLA